MSKEYLSPRQTSGEYLRALGEQGEQAEFAALIIGFEQRTCFLWNGTADAARRLDSLLNAGGKAVAILGMDIVGNAVVYHLDPFPPYAGDEEVQRYLARVGQEVMDAFEERWQNLRN